MSWSTSDGDDNGLSDRQGFTIFSSFMVTDKPSPTKAQNQREERPGSDRLIGITRTASTTGRTTSSTTIDRAIDGRRPARRSTRKALPGRLAFSASFSNRLCRQALKSALSTHFDDTPSPSSSKLCLRMGRENKHFVTQFLCNKKIGQKNV